MTLVCGEEIKLSLDDKHQNCGTASCIYVDYKNLTKVVSPGSRVSIYINYFGV